MFFRGVQFQRDEHAGCDLLLTRPLLSNSADLSRVGMRAFTGTIHHIPYARVIAHNRRRHGRHNCSDRYPFYATQSIVPGTGAVMRLCPRLQLAPSRSPHVEWSFVESLVAITHPHTRQGPAPRRREATGTRRQDAYTKDSCGFARVSDLCLKFIGESCSVSWQW